MTLGSLVLYFAALAIVDGLSSVFQAFSGRAETENWWVLLLEGLLGIAFGVIAFQAPGITALLLLLYIGFWAIATGALRIILAIRLRNEIEGEWWMVLAGLASILFGMAMIARPLAGALAVAHPDRRLVARQWRLPRPRGLQTEVRGRKAGDGQGPAGRQARVGRVATAWTGLRSARAARRGLPAPCRARAN